MYGRVTYLFKPFTRGSIPSDKPPPSQPPVAVVIKEKKREFEIPLIINIQIIANGSNLVFTVPENNEIRLVTIGGGYNVANYNVDQMYILNKTNNMLAYIDTTLGRPTPFVIPCGHWDGWLQPDWEVYVVISNFSAASTLTMRIWKEVKLITDQQ